MVLMQATQSDIGHIVRYYRGGWRFGVLQEIEGDRAVVQPPRANSRKVCVPLIDVEAVPCQQKVRQL